jgi:hypothetical protein
MLYVIHGPDHVEVQVKWLRWLNILNHCN